MLLLIAAKADFLFETVYRDGMYFFVIVHLAGLSLLACHGSERGALNSYV